MNILEIKNLTKYYGAARGVIDLSLELKEGEIFGFIGPNGAGKSTTIRSIWNLINKNQGQVLFDGKELLYNDLEIKKQIGYLPSEVNLYEDLSVKQMLDFHERFYNANIHERRMSLVNRLKLDETKKVSDLSLGNSKKLGIVLALMHNPRLIILDEPTSGLDPIIQKEFYNILLEEKQKGTTIFYSTHILSEISRLCDRVGIIKDGVLLKVEPINEIIDKNLTNVTITSDQINEIIEELAIKDYSQIENTITFKNVVDANTLIKKLVKFNIDKIYIEAASLEEIFYHYYE